MTSRRLGHRAAAQGLPREAPVNGDPMTWMLAFDAVEVHRASGLDPHGHPPHIPRLCSRDVTKVCNCCDGCQRECWSEGLVIKAESLKARAKKLVQQIARRVVR
ncbi:MAG TPA: hypothetical protein VGY48_15870 [Vicinamibacterales bacterium]|jgi:hypothetical protein|nr:hypothetical protein [Vicinamibacterales bacterium]